MFPFGHAGLTLGTMLLLTKVLPSSHSSKTAGNEAIESHNSSFGDTARPNNHPKGRFAFSKNRIDIRLLLIGSLLPDIIDKPLGYFLLRDTFSSGRIITHTLLFLILIMLAGYYLYRSRGKTGLLAISFGTFAHLIFDQMWRAPRTLFWPFYGATFARAEVIDWIPNMLHTLLTEPQVYIPEILGIVIFIWFTLTLVRRKRFFYFLRSGQV